MKTVEEIITIFGGIEGLYVSIENPPFMRLVIEHIGGGPHGLPAVSVAHYYELNGDLCQDPEMCFEIETTPDGQVLHPYMFQVAIPPVYQEVTNDAQGIALAEQLRGFAAMWDANPRAQGFIEAAQRQRTAALRDRADGEGHRWVRCCRTIARRIGRAHCRALYPQAVIIGDELECVACHQRGTPALIEEGMTVTHQLESLSDSAISARGWDGSTSDVSEEGERLLLECPHCFQRHRIPEAIELQWQRKKEGRGEAPLLSTPDFLESHSTRAPESSAT